MSLAFNCSCWPIGMVAGLIRIVLTVPPSEAGTDIAVLRNHLGDAAPRVALFERRLHRRLRLGGGPGRGDDERVAVGHGQAGVRPARC